MFNQIVCLISNLKFFENIQNQLSFLKTVDCDLIFFGNVNNVVDYYPKSPLSKKHTLESSSSSSKDDPTTTTVIHNDKEEYDN